MPMNWRQRLYYNPFPGWFLFFVIVLPALALALWAGWADSREAVVFRLSLVGLVIFGLAAWLSSAVDSWTGMLLGGGLVLCVAAFSALIYAYRTMD